MIALGPEWERVAVVISRTRGGLANVVPALPAAGEPRPVTIARPLVAQLFTAWQGLQDTLHQAKPGLVAVFADGRYTETGRRAQLDEQLTAVRTAIDSQLAAADAIVATLTTQLAGLARPPRPQPADAAQEAVLASMKADLRMALDGAPLNQVAGQLLAHARQYVVTGDALGTWLMGSTDWPCLYLRGRGFGARLAQFEAELPAVLALLPEQAAARSILSYVEGADGVAGALATLRSLVFTALDALSRR